MEGRNQFQLLPGTKKRLGIKVPGENKFLYIGSAILGAVLVASFAMDRYTGNLIKQVGDLNGQIIAIDDKRNPEAEKNLKVIKNQIDTASKLLANHVYWTQGLDKISSLIQGQVQLTSVSDLGSDKIGLGLIATSYSVVAKQISALIYDDSIEDIEVGKITLSSNGRIEFSVSLIFTKSKLTKKQPID